MKPHTSFVVCANHRSGSGILCDSLWQSNLAGRPDEYFSPKVERKYSNIWKTLSYSQYVEKVIENGTSPNGIFGAKIMWRQTHFLNLKVSRTLNNKYHNTHELMRMIFPNLKYIWLRRQNKIRQAISLWFRRQTGIFRWLDTTPTKYSNKPEFDFVGIHKLVQEFYKYDFCWLTYFRKYRINPFIVIYEDDLENGNEDVIRRILLYLGIIIPSGLAFQTRYIKQSDELSEKFVQLYKDRLKQKILKTHVA